MKHTVWLLLLNIGLASCSQNAPASEEATVSTPVYTYVEKMPEMPTGGGVMGVVGELQKQFRLPAFVDDGSTRYSGIQVAFVVGSDGRVQEAKILKSSNNVAMDNALLVAASHLPKLSPGYHNGKAVPVRLTIPISCIKPQFR